VIAACKQYPRAPAWSMRDHGRGSSKVSSRAALGGVLSSVDLCGFSCALCSKPAQNGTCLRRFIRHVRMHFSRDRRVEQTDLTLTPASLVNAPALRMTRNRIVSFHTRTLTHVSTPQVQGSLCGGWACYVAAVSWNAHFKISSLAALHRKRHAPHAKAAHRSWT
jgi:hypothetical protein